MSSPLKQTKTCKVCNQTKLDMMFYTGRRVCQECYRERQSKYYSENRETIKKENLARYYRSLVK